MKQKNPTKKGISMKPQTVTPYRVESNSRWNANIIRPYVVVGVDGIVHSDYCTREGAQGTCDWLNGY